MFGDVGLSPAWDAVTAYSPNALISLGEGAATSLIQAAVREAATQRQAAQNAGDVAAIATTSDRLTRLATWQALVNGGATSADIVDIAQTAPSLLPDVGGIVRTLVVAGVVVAGAWFLLPHIGRAVGEARGSKSYG